MTKLDNVTIVCIEGTSNIESLKNSIKAMYYSFNKIEFQYKIFISPKIKDEELLHQIKELGILHFEIEELDWYGYNRFILKNLYDYINTDYCLIVQWDGFILNHNLWLKEFYNYDYIGASWPDWLIQNSQWVYDDVKINKNYSLVGNGGFSFRSKKLLFETKMAEFDCNGPEDTYICINHYDYFLEKGIKFAPVSIADVFSREANHLLAWDSVFGFHGEKDFINRI
jgi:hypothetical protein